MLRIKVAIYEKDIETVNAYFNLAKSLAKENDLQLLLEFVQTEILNYTSMLSHTPLYEESVSLIEDPDPLGILAFIEAIINRQLEYLVLGAVQHRYSDEIPLCGDPRPFSEGLFCPKCRQLGLQKDIRMIVQRYLASTICSYCYYQVTNQQINDVISSYLASNPRGIYNPFLEITSPFFEGIIQWACPNPSCQNPDLFQFNLNEINHLFL